MFRAHLREDMVKQTLAAVFVLCSIACIGQNSGMPHGPDAPKGLKQYFIGFLMRTGNSDSMSDQERQSLMPKHLAYVRSQTDAGKYRLVAPFLDNGAIAGMLIIDTPTIDEAKDIISKDPMVLSGRFTSEVHPAMLADVSCVVMQYEKNGGK